jgi:predicted dehydrogenase
MAEHAQPSRRDFVQVSATVAAGLAAMSPRAYARILGANDRIYFGIIGIGTMGTGHLDGDRKAQDGLIPLRDKLNIDIVQTCDVYRKRAEEAAAKVGSQAKPTQNYEEVLANKNVDAILNATPDHWHAKIAIDAIKAGKHVYLEKPMCHTIEQALELHRIEQENKDKIRVQVGVQSTSFELNDKVREHIQKNGIGKLVMINSSYCRNNTAGQWRDYGAWENISDPKQAGIDWDLWLGHQHTCAGQQLAPKRAWDPKRFFQFRCYWDYSGGVATDLFFHRLTQLLKATGLLYPERVVAAGGIWVFNRDHQIPAERGGGPDDREVPDMYNTMIDYPGGPTVTLVGSMVNDTDVPAIIAGHDATIRFNNPEAPTEAIIEPQRRTGRIKERVVLKGEGSSQAKHRENFIKACRDAKVELYCPVSLALRTNVAITLGVKSYRERKYYGWDAKEQRAMALG